MPEVGLGYLEEGCNAYIRHYERTSIFHNSTPSPTPQTQQLPPKKPTQIPTAPSSTAKRAHSPDEPSNSKIPRYKSPTPSATLPISQLNKKKQSDVQTVLLTRAALPVVPKSPIQQRFDDMIAGKVANVDWQMLDEAKEIKTQLGLQAYRQFLEYVLKNSKRRLFISFLGKGGWRYGNRKGKEWMPWADIKPYIVDLDVKVNSGNGNWNGKVLIDFMKQNLLGAPKLSWVEFHIKYNLDKAKMTVEDDLFDSNRQPDWTRGVKYYVDDICVKLWKCPKVRFLRFTTGEVTGEWYHNTVRWYGTTREAHGWSKWEEEEY